MFYTILQYIFIGVVFIIAVIYVVKLTKESFGGNKGCSKGCGCEGGIKDQLQEDEEDKQVQN